jgi:Na+/H+ antiporter NhaD/arsenite permease-like protein
VGGRKVMTKQRAWIGGPLALAFGLFLCQPALAAAGLDGRSMSFAWAIPLIGMLACIATGPLLFPHVWEHHYGKIAFGWGALVVSGVAATTGVETAFQTVMHTFFAEYLSFIVLLFALFTLSGGLLIKGNIHGSPLTNTGLLAIGAVLASVIGTTGASMVLIRPVIRANDDRVHNVHIIVFFIFLVSNIGGSLTPLGDPPLFIGFLRGVDFFWTTTHLFHETFFVVALLLTVFFALDTYFYRKAGERKPDPTPDDRISLKGGINLVLLALVIAAILASASWQPGISIRYPGGAIELQNLLRDVFLIVLALVSLKLTPSEAHEGNGFTWEPIKEVAKLFAAIFLCIVPVIAILHAGKDGALAPLVAAVTRPDGSPDNAAYFWLTGLLSSVLDNAPTYLVFFELAGGDPTILMGAKALTLAAISSGAVFMGANTYIGNAPNFMVYAIARNQGIAMPSFFGYMGWSLGILVPAFVLATLIFFY